MPWSLSFVLTSQSHQHGKTAFEKAGVRVMSICLKGQHFIHYGGNKKAGNTT